MSIRFILFSPSEELEYCQSDTGKIGFVRVRIIIIQRKYVILQHNTPIIIGNDL